MDIARLKKFTGLGYLYKRLRDKATAAIDRTYPELADLPVPEEFVPGVVPPAVSLEDLHTEVPDSDSHAGPQNRLDTAA